MRILVVGADGLVGRALRARIPEHGYRLVALNRAECDVTVSADRERALALARPDLVIFCAAFTRVDLTTPEAAAVNAEAPGAWAAQVPTLWLSSNFVMGGPGPHPPERPPRPEGTYAVQKVQGEQAVLAAGGTVARVGWIYGPGGQTFASTLVKRFESGERVAAVWDVVVQPSWSLDVADGLLSLVQSGLRPGRIEHVIGSGETTWYRFALAVWARVRRGEVAPVRQRDLGLRAPRPEDARLIPATLPPWWARVDTLVAAHRTQMDQVP